MVRRKTNWKFRKLREKYEYLKESKPVIFFKNVIGITKKSGYSLDEKIEREKRKISFNNFFGTKYFIKWKQTGKADLYQIIEIIKKNEKTGQIALF